MLTEDDIRERAQYCYCVCLQLGWLHDNELVAPNHYLDTLQKSSLQLADDEFVVTTIEEALLMGQPDGGLTALLALYEGFVHAYCDVLESDMEQIGSEVPQEFLQQLASEVGVEIKL